MIVIRIENWMDFMCSQPVYCLKMSECSVNRIKIHSKEFDKCYLICRTLWWIFSIRILKCWSRSRAIHILYALTLNDLFRYCNENCVYIAVERNSSTKSLRVSTLSWFWFSKSSLLAWHRKKHQFLTVFCQSYYSL